MLREATVEEMRAMFPHVLTRLDSVERELRDQAQRFDTLQTPLWRRLLFRLDGWPGQQDLNATGRAWRPWH